MVNAQPWDEAEFAQLWRRLNDEQLSVLTHADVGVTAPRCPALLCHRRRDGRCIDVMQRCEHFAAIAACASSAERSGPCLVCRFGHSYLEVMRARI